MPTCRRGAPAGATLLLTILFAPPLAGQAVLTGTVRDDSTGRPLAGAEVLIEGLGLRAVTGEDGRYVLGPVHPGFRQILVRMLGYHPSGRMVEFVGGDTLRADVALEATAFQLDPLEVTGRAPGPRGIGVEAFEERRLKGFGRFIDSTELRRSEHLRVDDVLRRHAGIEIRESKAMSPRSRDAAGGPDCYMQIYLDGIPQSRGGRVGADPAVKEEAPDLRLLIEVAQLAGVEVYRSAAEIPTEYSGPTAACGVILLWTRRGP